MRNKIIAKITAAAAKDKRIFIISGDAGYGVLDEFQKKYPSRFLNLGIAEQNTISFAAGLALGGYKVFLYNIIPFLLYRSYEQVRNDICYQRLPVTLIGLGSGVTYGMQGMTHYSVEDIAIARTIPNLTVLSPCDPQEAERSIEFAIKAKQPVYIRISKSGEPAIHTRTIKNITEPQLVAKGIGVAVLFHGSIASEVVKALAELRQVPKLISVPMLQPLHGDSLRGKLKDIHTLITVEEHFSDGGLGTILGEWILREGLNFRLKKLGIKNEFIHTIKNNAGLRKHYKISSPDIQKAIIEAFGHG